MKILLVCSAGMSTSLIVKKMKEVLKSEEKDWVIDAIPSERFKDKFKDYDVILLGPQMRFKKEDFQKVAGEYDIPVGTIKTTDYGLANGKNILNFAKKLYKERNKI